MSHLYCVGAFILSSSLTLEALQVLDAIARRGSFAAAAQELNRAPSSLSYQVQKLEQDLDLVIFDRSGHKAVFTEAGQLLLNRGRILLSAANDLVEDANILAHGWELEISIAYDLLPIQFFFHSCMTYLPYLNRGLNCKKKYWRVVGKHYLMTGLIY